MIAKGERLRKVSDDAYQEATPPDGHSRPLEWRRSLNTVTFTLKDPTLTTSCEVTNLDRDWSLDEKEIKHPAASLKPSVRIVRAITATVDSNSQRDTLYRLLKTDEKNVFAVEMASKEMQIVLKEGEALKENSKIPDGVFYGSIFRADYEPKQDYMCLEATMPAAQINAIIEALTNNHDVKIAAIAYVLSLSFEVDDSLREWYHPRNLIIDENFALAPIKVLSISSTYGKRGSRDVGSVFVDAYAIDGDAVQPSPATQIIDLVPLTKAIVRIGTAIWVAIAIAVLIAIFR